MSRLDPHLDPSAPHARARRLRITALAALVALVTGCAESPSLDVVLNEVTSTGDDAIELMNTGTEVVDVSGWAVTDSEADLPGHRYVLPAGTLLAPGEHRVLVKGKDHTFGLGSDDAVGLEDETGLRVDRADYAAGQAAVSFCRSPDGTGRFGPCAVATFGEANP